MYQLNSFSLFVALTYKEGNPAALHVNGDLTSYRNRAVWQTVDFDVKRFLVCINPSTQDKLCASSTVWAQRAE
jgi:hypothetical protein